MDRDIIKNHFPKFHIVTEERYKGTALGYINKRKWKESIKGKMYIMNNGTEYPVKDGYIVAYNGEDCKLNPEQIKKVYFKN